MSDTPREVLPLATRVRLLRRTLFEIVAYLHMTAERAEIFSGKKRPRISGSPKLELQREALSRLYDQALTLLRHDGGNLSALQSILRAADVVPPHPVDTTTYTHEAVINLAGIVLGIGWGAGEGFLRGARDPWHGRTPAQRLNGPERWVWRRVRLPYFGDPAVYNLFNASLAREFDRAERLTLNPPDSPVEGQSNLVGRPGGIRGGARSAVGRSAASVERKGYEKIDTELVKLIRGGADTAGKLLHELKKPEHKGLLSGLERAWRKKSGPGPGVSQQEARRLAIATFIRRVGRHAKRAEGL